MQKIRVFVRCPARMEALSSIDFIGLEQKMNLAPRLILVMAAVALVAGKPEEEKSAAPPHDANSSDVDGKHEVTSPSGKPDQSLKADQGGDPDDTFGDPDDTFGPLPLAHGLKSVPRQIPAAPPKNDGILDELRRLQYAVETGCNRWRLMKQ
jgi:hypothetical protein